MGPSPSPAPSPSPSPFPEWVKGPSNQTYHPSSFTFPPKNKKKIKKNHNFQFIFSILYFIQFFILSIQFISLPLLYIPPIIKKNLQFILSILYFILYFILSNQFISPPLLYIFPIIKKNKKKKK